MQVVALLFSAVALIAVDQSVKAIVDGADAREAEHGKAASAV